MDCERIIAEIEQLPRYAPARYTDEHDVYMDGWSDGEWIKIEDVIAVLEAHLSPISQPL